MNYKELIKNIDKNQLENYYSNHLPSECMKEFKIPSNYIPNRILDEFKIKRHSVSENTLNTEHTVIINSMKIMKKI